MASILRKVKDTLYSENGMRIVNVLFFLTWLSRSWLMFLSYAVWIVYLVFGIKHTESKTVKIVLSVFVALAAVMICLGLYSYTRTQVRP